MYYVNGKSLRILESKQYRLNSRTIVGKTEENIIVLIKDRKSRIIMKDGKQLLDQVRQIKKHEPDINLALATNAPICSKTTKFFKENGIAVYRLEK